MTNAVAERCFLYNRFQCSSEKRAAIWRQLKIAQTKPCVLSVIWDTPATTFLIPLLKGKKNGLLHLATGKLIRSHYLNTVVRLFTPPRVLDNTLFLICGRVGDMGHMLRLDIILKSLTGRERLHFLLTTTIKMAGGHLFAWRYIKRKLHLYINCIFIWTSAQVKRTTSMNPNFAIFFLL